MHIHIMIIYIILTLHTGNYSIKTSHTSHLIGIIKWHGLISICSIEFISLLYCHLYRYYIGFILNCFKRVT